MFDTAEKLISGWLWRSFICQILIKIMGINLFVLVWGLQTTPTERALYVICAQCTQIFWFKFGESEKFRAFLVEYLIAAFIVFHILDFMMMPVIFYSPFIYLLIYMILLDGAWDIMSLVTIGEIKEVLITDPNSRNRFTARMKKFSGCGAIIGGILSMVFPFSAWPIEWIVSGLVGKDMIIMSLQAIMVTYTRRYMTRYNLQYYCCM